MNKITNFYITTTLPYVNAEPHIGFGLEIVEADVIARFCQLMGVNVIFNTGTDEHGQKIYQQALLKKISTQKYCDHYVQKFLELKKLLNLSYTHFTRTTNSQHQHAAQAFWKEAKKNGFIYKDLYQTKYCVGCELEKTDSELKNSRCPLHPNLELELRQEENYFFRFSAFKDRLLTLYKEKPNFVKPVSKYRELIAFVSRGLKDFSISRLKKKMPWGIPVPDDDTQVMYVWFDALINYVSALGWPQATGQFQQFWPAVQLAGKDNLRQQAAMWQAMLMSVNLPPSKKILINGFISVDGQKMSKSLGNVISPKQMVDRFGVDATRFLLISLGVFSKDIDVSMKKFDFAYQKYLANGLGNLCSRIAKLAHNAKLGYSSTGKQLTFTNKFAEKMISYQLTKALEMVNKQIVSLDKYLSEKKPWLLENHKQHLIINKAIKEILSIAFNLQPFMPETSHKIITHFQSTTIQPLSPIFPRLSNQTTW